MTMAPEAKRTITEVPRRADRAYLDFVTGLGLLDSEELKPAMRRVYEDAAKQWEVRHGAPPSTLDDAKAMLDPVPLVRWYKRLERSRQEMNWNGAIRAAQAYATELERAIDEAAQRGPGKLLLDPNLRFPDYYAENEFHIQPGSYHGFPLSGYVYFFGARVFHLGRGTDPEDRKRDFVNQARAPADGRVRRVLDLACGVGSGTIAWKHRFPQAEVWGIDLSAPMVRYAHKRAVDQGIEVHFAQMAAEDPKFPANHFDVVYANILFHEVPVEVGERIIAETYRLLRPGGTFTVMDFTSAKTWTPWDTYLRDYDQHNNGEPFSMDFCHWDFPAALEAAGFQDVREEQVGPLHMRRSAEK